MVLTGYNRLRCLNMFLDTGVQAHLMNNIGRNERVIIAECLMGKTGQHSPVLSVDLNEKIKSIDLKSTPRFVSQVKRFLDRVDKTHGIKNQLMHVETLFRYMNMQTHYGDIRFSNIIIAKCVELLNAIDDERRMLNEHRVIHHNTRTQVKRRQMDAELIHQMVKSKAEINICFSRVIEYRESLLQA